MMRQFCTLTLFLRIVTISWKHKLCLKSKKLKTWLSSIKTKSKKNFSKRKNNLKFLTQLELWIWTLFIGNQDNLKILISGHMSPLFLIIPIILLLDRGSMLDLIAISFKEETGQWIYKVIGNHLEPDLIPLIHSETDLLTMTMTKTTGTSVDSITGVSHLEEMEITDLHFYEVIWWNWNLLMD